MKEIALFVVSALLSGAGAYFLTMKGYVVARNVFTTIARRKRNCPSSAKDPQDGEPGSSFENPKLITCADLPFCVIVSRMLQELISAKMLGGPNAALISFDWAGHAFVLQLKIEGRAEPDPSHPPTPSYEEDGS